MQRTAVVPLVATAAFVVLAIAVHRGATEQLNRRARKMVRPRKQQRLTGAARFCSNIAAPHVHPFVALGMALLVSRRVGRPALSMPIASLGAIVADRGVRYLIKQERPPGASRHPGLDRFAFPSGHTGATTAIAVAVTAEVLPYMRPTARRVTTFVAAATAVGIAWTRLYLDEHWVDDVVGGWLAGVVIGSVSVATTNVTCDAPGRTGQ